MRRKRAKKRTRQTAAPPNLRGEAVVDGVTPKRGMFLVQPKRRRCYGPILRVDRFGRVHIKGSFGTVSKVPGSVLFEGGYRYVDALPSGDGWRYRVDLGWHEDPPQGWLSICDTNGIH